MHGICLQKLWLVLIATSIICGEENAHRSIKFTYLRIHRLVTSVSIKCVQAVITRGICIHDI